MFSRDCPHLLKLENLLGPCPIKFGEKSCTLIRDNAPSGTSRNILAARLSRFKLQIRGIFDGISPSSPEIIIIWRREKWKVIKILRGMEFLTFDYFYFSYRYYWNDQINNNRPFNSKIPIIEYWKSSPFFLFVNLILDFFFIITKLILYSLRTIQYVQTIRMFKEVSVLSLYTSGKWKKKKKNCPNFRPKLKIVKNFRISSGRS